MPTLGGCKYTNKKLCNAKISSFFPSTKQSLHFTLKDILQKSKTSRELMRHKKKN